MPNTLPRKLAGKGGTAGSTASGFLAAQREAAGKRVERALTWSQGPGFYAGLGQELKLCEPGQAL